MRPRAIRALACAVLSIVLCGCTPKMERPAAIILITLDTTRADHLGCYGYAAAVTPNLDAFAKEAVRFDQAMSAVPTTLPSHSTMFTGQVPAVHGVRYNGMFTLGAASVTIAERLHDAGFATGAVPAAYPVYAKSGLAQGFDTYLDLFSEPGNEHLPAESERPASDVTKLGLETIRGMKGKPFFVWLHYYDAHYPYKPPFPFSASHREHPYDGEIAYVDTQLGELFKALRADGMWDRVAIVIAGDHGEGLYEHGERMHSQLAYQSTLRVPLLIKAPGVKAGTVIREPVTLADIGPTIADLAGLPAAPGLDGISLRESLRGKDPPRRALYFETLSGALNFGWSPIEGLRRGKWKLIRSTDPELYDLEADPGEQNNLITTEATQVADLTALLDRDISRWTKAGTPAQTTTAPIDPLALSRLASLGYIGGAVSDARRGGPSPRSMEHLESDLLLLQEVMSQHLFLPAMQSAQGVLKSDPANRLALSSAVDASIGLKDYESARRYGRDLVERYPEYVPGWVTQGRLSVAQKDYKSAESYFRRGLENVPGEPVLLYSLALTLLTEKRPADAEPLVDEGLTRPRPDPMFQIMKGVCRALAGDQAGAKQALSNAIAAGYKDFESLHHEPVLEPLLALPGFDEIVAAKKGA